MANEAVFATKFESVTKAGLFASNEAYKRVLMCMKQRHMLYL